MSHRSLNPQHKGLTLTEFVYVSYVNQCLRQIPLEPFFFMVLLTLTVATADKILTMYPKCPWLPLNCLGFLLSGGQRNKTEELGVNAPRFSPMTDRLGT